MVIIDQDTEEHEIQAIIEVILACDHALDDDYDNHPEAVIDLTNMATSMVYNRGEVHLSDLRKMAADRLQSNEEAQCAIHKCPHCDEELECVLFTEWGYKVRNGKEWVDEMPFSNAEFRCSQCNGSLDYEELVAMGVV